MAKLLTPTKEYNIDNCPCLHVADSSLEEHPEGFDDYPQFFVYEVFDQTRTEAECPSDNNPLLINHTGNIKL